MARIEIGVGVLLTGLSTLGLITSPVTGWILLAIGLVLVAHGIWGQWGRAWRSDLTRLRRLRIAGGSDSNSDELLQLLKEAFVIQYADVRVQFGGTPRLELLFTINNHTGKDVQITGETRGNLRTTSLNSRNGELDDLPSRWDIQKRTIEKRHEVIVQVTWDMNAENQRQFAPFAVNQKPLILDFRLMEIEIGIGDVTLFKPLDGRIEREALLTKHPKFEELFPSPIRVNPKIVTRQWTEEIGGDEWVLTIRNTSKTAPLVCRAKLEQVVFESKDVKPGQLPRQGWLAWVDGQSTADLWPGTPSELGLVRWHQGHELFKRENGQLIPAGGTKFYDTIAYADADLSERKRIGLSVNDYPVLMLVGIYSKDYLPHYVLLRVDPAAMDTRNFTGAEAVTIKYEDRNRPNLERNDLPF